MIRKWKIVLMNWINCYFNESDKKQQYVNLESLLIIISHLRENLNLDESKSSILEAHTVEEFILEKYPEFKFENGTVEPTTEEDIYIVASLLLYFVCVNSKDVDIKSAMCNKLSSEDQEIILKFSKCLMECSPISYRDVQNAITEACGQDIAAKEVVSQVTVAETPPALRSLHGEVRRLQAALDAERFDRNYLQEELARTNLWVKKLLKDKEQYKLDIVNLKSKISLCCGSENEERGAETGDSANSSKLTKQLHELEERLIEIQGQLDDAQYERDTYKTKLDDLKHERDKWLALSQQETSRASKLADELETERCQVHSLQEIIADLQQYNQFRRIDSSQLECDDPDMSIPSLPQNLSVCSEVCANVVEVQLSEERAKIVVFKQQIQSLQDQLSDLNQRSLKEKQSYEEMINAKDAYIFDLNHRFFDKIEENNNLEANFKNEVTKLNNEINELEQKLKDNSENSRIIIESKMQEIQTVREEKLSLLQSFSDETSKLENIITDLKMDIDMEKKSKLKMKEDFENHIMKLNEKVLNRNNELVELQNKILEKGEMIESLQLDLKKQKKENENLSNKYNNLILQLNEQIHTFEHNLQQKTEEAKDLQNKLQDINKEIGIFEKNIAELNNNCKFLEETKVTLIAELQNSNSKIEEVYKEMENTKNSFIEEKEKLQINLDEKIAELDTLHMQLKNEIEVKMEFQSELKELRDVKTSLLDNVKTLNAKITQLNVTIQKKDETINAMHIKLKEENGICLKWKTECDAANEKIKILFEQNTEKDNEIKSIKDKFETEKKSLENQLHTNDNIIESTNIKLSAEIAEKNTLQNMLTILNNEKDEITRDLSEKSKIMLQQQMEIERLLHVTEKNQAVIKTLENNVEEEALKFTHLEKKFNDETSKLMTKINNTNKVFKQLKSKLKNTIEMKDLQIQTLNIEFEKLQRKIEDDTHNFIIIQKEKEALSQRLTEEMSFKDKFEKEYQNQCTVFNDATAQLNEEIVVKNKEISVLNMELQLFKETVEDKCKEIKIIQEKLSDVTQTAKKVTSQKNVEVKELHKKIEELDSLNDELELELKKEVDNKMQTAQALLVLRKENEQLHFTIEEDNSNHELILREKDTIIDNLERELKVVNIRLQSMQKNYKDETLKWEKRNSELQQILEAKDNNISSLKQLVSDLENTIKQNLIETENIKTNLTLQVDTITKEFEDVKSRLEDEISSLTTALAVEEKKQIEIVNDKVALAVQLTEVTTTRDALQTEREVLKNENDSLNEKLLQEKADYDVLLAEKDTLVIEKAVLTQKLLEEKSIRDLTENEKKYIEQQLTEEIEIKNTLLQEKECLTKQLVEETSVKNLTEQENQHLLVIKQQLEDKLIVEATVKDNLIHENNCLVQKLVQEKEIKDILKDDKIKLTEELTTLKSIFESTSKDKEHLFTENNLLKQDLVEHKAVQDVLVKDREMVVTEKENLVKSLSEEKSARDEIESEKNTQLDKLNELNEKYLSGLNSKQEELEHMAVEMKQLEMHYKEQEKTNLQLSSVLTNVDLGLEKLMQTFKIEDIGNEVLQKLIVSEKSQDMSVSDKCDLLINIADTLTTELSLRKNLEKALEYENTTMNKMRELFKQKEIQLLEQQAEIKRLQHVINESKMDISKQTETYNTSLETKMRDIQKLQLENQSLHNELNDVKIQLEVKVHSLKEKLVDNENLTDKLKKTYECQIDNLNLMTTKLTNYLKDKTIELESMRRDKERLQQVVENNGQVIKSLQDEVKSQKLNQEKLISDFESERLVLKNMVTVTESVMEDQKVSLNNVITEHSKATELLQAENKTLKELITKEKQHSELKVKDKDAILDSMFKEMTALRHERENLEKNIEMQKDQFSKEITILNELLQTKITHIESLESQSKELTDLLQKYKDDIAISDKKIDELGSLKVELQSQINSLKDTLNERNDIIKKFESALTEKSEENTDICDKVKALNVTIENLLKQKNELEQERNQYIAKLDEANTKLNENISKENEELAKLKKDNLQFVNIIEENKSVINNLKLRVNNELEQNNQLRVDTGNEKLNLANKCSLLEEYQTKAEIELADRQKEITSLKEQVKTLCIEVESCKKDMKEKDDIILRINQEKDAIVNTKSMELSKEKAVREKYQKELEVKVAAIYELKQKLEDGRNDDEVEALRKENEELVKAIGKRETFVMPTQEKTSFKYLGHIDKDIRDLHHQVDNSSHSDLIQSSTESIKTITDLEKIIHDKNRTITTLQSDITYLKSLMAESENKLLDVTKELDVSKENCQQLSSQLKKIVHQKNEEIAELKKQVTKMSVTENRATQIIKVSAKYQAIILKRVAEIKSNTVLKELTNFGNSTSNSDSELRRSLSAGAITMEDLENFLETTERHLRRCSEKQVALQKERDRLSEVNRINDSEIISLKKFLTELSVSFKTFSSVKEMYAQKLSRVVSLQRTVRREILNLDGHVTDATMCKLERGYAAVIQDLSECAMNLERWVERNVSRMISPEKIKQAFVSDDEHFSLVSSNYQNASLDVQLEELENSFQKLLDEVVRAQRGEAAKETQATTVMEVRAEYEDKLNRMKAKMKQLYQEQISVFREKQKDEIALLERELQKARDKLAESSRAYEEHIRSLTTELWSVGEKFLMKKDEAEWLRRKQRSGSLMSLQHVHSSGLVPPQEEPSRPSDTHSLHSLPVNNNKSEGRGLHMSDEEGEVFDNRWLRELAATPRVRERERERDGDRGLRLSELRWRNSLCPPHLKSSYPAETQFAPALDEEDIKCTGAGSTMGGKQQRKEVGITAYKKPGPPTPSKQAGRLSATDSELRESLRPEPEAYHSHQSQQARKTSTPSRIRAFFRPARNDNTDGTPRSRRLSNIFKKK